MNKWLLLTLLPGFLFAGESKPFVQAEIRGQLGNNLFIVATTCALAWDNNAVAYFPHLRYYYTLNPQNVPSNISHIFYRCNVSQPSRPIAFSWSEPSFAYHEIPFHSDMSLHGYFQSEKYFVRHREKLLQLFAPHPDDLKYVQTKYQWLLEHPCTVGIHLRHQWEDPSGDLYIQYGKDYLQKAMKSFPENSLFILFSDNMEFAIKNIPEEMQNRVKYVKGEAYFIDFLLMTLCKHNLITNSSFGWWVAWLNQNPNKIITAPHQWYNPKSPLDTRDVLPESWIKIDAKWGPMKNPTTYQ